MSLSLIEVVWLSLMCPAPCWWNKWRPSPLQHVVQQQHEPSPDSRSMARPLKEGRSIQEHLQSLKRQSSLLDGIFASMENWRHWIAKGKGKGKKGEGGKKGKGSGDTLNPKGKADPAKGKKGKGKRGRHREVRRKVRTVAFGKEAGTRKDWPVFCLRQRWSFKEGLSVCQTPRKAFWWIRRCCGGCQSARGWLRDLWCLDYVTDEQCWERGAGGWRVAA